ncbi:hypothetical protein [Paenibacillus methanolicus]|uniref:Uncharacterized protein n=1 Tax=Paenibacillus methanolicus TaxID=582686 RepID=A0A5S5BPL8_9BACL|nr:hypothetical protein [Paenibacillus methanolicus]TYP68937.1 hypothetical protein BCM02_11755 [Paenibacillus methanolicus]
MNDSQDSKASSTFVKDSDRKWFAALSAAAGIIALGAVWYFYADNWQAGDLPWYGWIQPALMALGGIMALAASPLILARSEHGKPLFQMALGMIPVVFALRLLIVVVFLVGRLFDGSIFDRMPEHIEASPLKIAINAAVVIAIIQLVKWSKKAKSNSK